MSVFHSCTGEPSDKAAGSMIRVARGEESLRHCPVECARIYWVGGEHPGQLVSRNPGLRAFTRSERSARESCPGLHEDPYESRRLIDHLWFLMKREPPANFSNCSTNSRFVGIHDRLLRAAELWIAGQRLAI